MNRTKIEWADYVWNPIKGLCPVECWYCYATKMYRRFRWDRKIRYESDDLKILWQLPGKEGSKIFVCSTFELFHPSVKKEWRDNIFNIIKGHPQHTFQILTKMPESIDRPMPDNVWLGVTITGENGDHWKVGFLESIKTKIKFVSYEPMLAFPGYGFMRFGLIPWRRKVNWVILGRLTGCGHKRDPKRYWIESILENAKEWGIPIFLKDNLREIWGEPLIQEFPE